MKLTELYVNNKANCIGLTIGETFITESAKKVYSGRLTLEFEISEDEYVQLQAIIDEKRINDMYKLNREREERNAKS